MPVPPVRSGLRLVLLTALAMLAFAANSLLCRAALASGSIGAGAFTLVRVASGAAVLAVLCAGPIRAQGLGGSWRGAAALVTYALAFSLAYGQLGTGTGALLLFGAVQVTMIAYGRWTGERLRWPQWLGLALAAAGLVWLVLPGVTAPPLAGAGLMGLAGAAWGAYSLLGRGARQPTWATAGNFVRAVPLAGLPVLLWGASAHASAEGIAWAVASGALASGLGYALWYAVLPVLSPATAATVQLSVPVIAALGGVVWLGEGLSGRLAGAALAILGGIALFVLGRRR